MQTPMGYVVFFWCQLAAIAAVDTDLGAVWAVCFAVNNDFMVLDGLLDFVTLGT